MNGRLAIVLFRFSLRFALRFRTEQRIRFEVEFTSCIMMKINDFDI
jgi:hypothetical protein